MKSIRSWLGIVLAGLVIIITLQNIATVEVNFLLWTFALPRAVLLFVLFGAGILVGLLMAQLPRRRDNDPR